MALCRLVGRNILRAQLVGREPGILMMARSVTIKPTAVQPCKGDTYDERNMKIGRPQSPHLTIYKYQLTSVLSITHRATGLAVGGYGILLALSAIALPEPISHYIDSLEQANLPLALIIATKAVIAFPFCYHTFNGIRHLIWDCGLLLSKQGVYSTGYAMLAASFLTTCILCAL